MLKFSENGERAKSETSSDGYVIYGLFFYNACFLESWLNFFMELITFLKYEGMLKCTPEESVKNEIFGWKVEDIIIKSQGKMPF